MKNCIKCNTELTGLQKKFCSKECKGKAHQYNSYLAQQERGLSRKISFVKKLGGQCSVCGYKKNVSALDFHHVDPSTKKFQLDLRVLSNNKLSVLEEELNKCILVCSNCHREIHNTNPKLLLD